MFSSAILHWLRSALLDRRLASGNEMVSGSQTLGLAVGLLMLIGLVGCAQPLSTPAADRLVQRNETMALPTEAPTTAPSPVNTRVLPLQTFTVVPTSPLTPTMTPIPAEVRGLVVEALDGDSIAVVLQGDPPSRIYQVHYLGIEAPPNSPGTPWGTVAFETNRKLTNLKAVRLVQDQTGLDEAGHLWRYVYVGDELLSIILVEQGLARANIVEPDTRFRAEIEEAEARAREGRLGLWSNQPPTPTPPRTQPTPPEGEATSAPDTPSLATTATPVTTTTVTAPAVTGEADDSRDSASENDAPTDEAPTAEGTAETENQ